MDWKKWIKAAGIRAIGATAQTAVASLGAGVVGIIEADWAAVASVSLMAGCISLLKSLAGLPELEGVKEVD